MRRLPVLPILAALAGGFALPAHAFDYCVQTQSEFNAALFAARFAPGVNEIRLGAARTFLIAGSPLYGAGYSFGNLTFSGGWNTACTARTTRDAATSILDGNGMASGSSLALEASSHLGMETLSIINVPGPISIDVTGDNGSIILRRLRFLDGRTVKLMAHGGDDQRVEVRDSLFARFDGLELFSAYGSDARLRMVNSTITRSRRDGVILNHHDDSDALFELHNSILHGNGTSGGYLDLRTWVEDNIKPLAVNNIVGTGGGGWADGSSGNLSVDPQFVSSTNYHLKAGSPAIDSGSNAVPGGLSGWDVEGNPRQAGALVDRGAYEYQTVGYVILVTNTNESGAGSLRKAISDANATPGPNVIGFNIPGSCPQVIAVASDLPAISDTLRIDGYSQPGAAWPTHEGPGGSWNFTPKAKICVELTRAGSAAGTGLKFSSTTAGDSLDVSGLAITNFGTGLEVSGDTGTRHSIWGNFIGLRADGDIVRANGYGVRLTGASTGTLGGDELQHRNIIAGNFAGVEVVSNAAQTVNGNFIGTDAPGTQARGNSVGLVIRTPDNEVSGNLVSGNTGDGIWLHEVIGRRNLLANNRVGYKSWASGASTNWALGNGGHGLLLSDKASKNHVARNSIGWNDGAGIRVEGKNTLGNTLKANLIRDNGGLGIDIGSVGPDPINTDPSDAHDLPNHGQNPPELFSARGGNASGLIEGQLQSVDGTFLVEFFASSACDPSGHGEGQTWLGDAAVTVSGATASTNGLGSFTAGITGSNLVGKAITATATMASVASLRFGSTSEFSACTIYQFDDLIFADGFDGA